MSGRLRTYARLSSRSQKVKDGAHDFRAVYAEVDARSEGRCEVWTAGARCPRRGLHHHHLFKPRRSHHTAHQVIHACPGCHDRMEWPFKRGRLCYVGALQNAGQHPTFHFLVQYSASKFQARGQGE